jgi:hypothetical protein
VPLFSVVQPFFAFIFVSNSSIRMTNPADATASWNVLRAVERQLGCQLPEGYAAAMHTHNGGELPTESDLWELYPIPGWPEQRVGHNAYGDLVSETFARRGRSLFPEGAVALADNGLGDQLCFLPDVDLQLEPGALQVLAPALWFWQHDTGELERLADAFESLERVL